MANQVPESLHRLIAALDIIFLFIYLAVSYLPFIYSSWNYRKGITLRRDLWIVSATLVVSAIRMTGMLFFIIYYIINESGSLNRVILSLRVMLTLVISPIDAKVTRWAFKTCKSVRGMKKQNQETGPQQPSTRTEPMTPISRSQQILAPINPSGESLLAVDGSFLHEFLLYLYWIVPVGIFIAATVCAGLAMSKSQQPDRYRFHTIMIWLLPSIFLIINRWFSSAGRPSPANPSLLRPDGWYSWVIGTMLGVVIFLISYGFNCKLKQGAITDMTDFWIQFTGAITGWGG